MKYSGEAFDDHVRDKFKKLFPDYEHEDLENAFKELKIASLIPNINRDGTIDKTCTIGLSHLEISGCMPAAVESPLSHQKLNEISSGSQGAGANLNMETRYGKTLVVHYHKAQRELLRSLQIKCDEDGWMLVGNSQRAQSEEFAQAIDKESLSVIEECADQSAPTEAESDLLVKKIELCHSVLVKRLWSQASSMHHDNDFMTEDGWKVWREHAWVVGSFAVLFVSLQLCRKSKRGTFYIMHEKTPRKRSFHESSASN